MDGINENVRTRRKVVKKWLSLNEFFTWYTINTKARKIDGDKAKLVLGNGKFIGPKTSKLF